MDNKNTPQEEAMLDLVSYHSQAGDAGTWQELKEISDRVETIQWNWQDDEEVYMMADETLCVISRKEIELERRGL